MDLHYGHTVEKIIRRNGYSISELARLVNVNRRSIYNWFNQKHLKSDIILKIGCALRYDFSNDFPHIFSPQDFKNFEISKSSIRELDGQRFSDNSAEYWKDKYIDLLEKYKDLLNETICNQVNESKR